MKSLIVRGLAALLFVVSATCAADGVGSDNNTKAEQLGHALQAMQFVVSFKYGLNYQKQQLGVSTPFIEGALQTDNAILRQLFASVYARHLTQQEVETLVRFYESPTGRELTAQQARDPANANPSLNLTQAQLAEAQTFSTSAAAQKLQWLMTNDEVRDETNHAIGSVILGHALAGRNL